MNGHVKFQNGKILTSNLFLLQFNIYTFLLFFLCSADWYKDRLTDAQLDELENPKPVAKTRVKGPSRRKQAKKPVEEEEDEE